MVIRNRLRALWHPACYHGWGRNKRFFEGWYYKLVNRDQSQAMAIIPGIAMDENGQKQAFIQVLDGIKETAVYHQFDADEFVPSPSNHSLKIGDNFFSEDRLKLALPQLTGEIFFEDLHPWSSSFFSPGIMGPFSFVPFMECYHGILSMNHTLSGELIDQNNSLAFTGGKGYMEKDWGHSFPEAYLWMQTNHFSDPGVSIKASIAKIPWLGSSFIGQIAGVLFQEKLYEFTTYNGTRLRHCKITSENVYVEMANRKHRLRLNAKREKATALAAPISGFMDGRVEESMKAQVSLELYDLRAKKILLADTGTSAGIEVAGNFSLLER